MARAGGLTALALLTGCAAGHDYEPPQPQVPAAFIDRGAVAGEGTGAAGWWVSFGDPAAVEITLAPAPQPGDPPGTTSLFTVAVPATVSGRPLELTVPSLTVAGTRFRFTA